MNETVELIKSLIRPYIAVTGWTAFLIIVCIALNKFLDLEMARSLVFAFTSAVSLIVGVWIGGRLNKPKE